jgi:hypothetical protein
MKALLGGRRYLSSVLLPKDSTKIRHGFGTTGEVEDTMKRRKFCNIIGGSIVLSKAQELLAVPKKDAIPASPKGGTPAAESGLYAPLRARRPWTPGPVPTLPSFDWKSLLANREIRFLTDNRLSIYIDTEPGISRVHYFPVRERPKLVGKLDYDSMAKENQFNSSGAKIRFHDADGTRENVDETEYQWWPHKIERLWSGKDLVVKEELAVLGNQTVLRLTPVRGSGIYATVEGSNPPHSFSPASIHNRTIFKFENGVALAPFVSGAAEIKVTPEGYRATVSFDKPVLILLCVGYEPEDIFRDLQFHEEDPGAIFDQARKRWELYFNSMAPRIESSDTKLVELYEYLFYVVRSSLYDIPWEPYVHAYTCPWKTGAIWQWGWNTPMNAITERWLNDGSLAKEGISLIRNNCGAANLGSYLHPVQSQQKCWNIFDWGSAVDRAQKKLETEDYDFLFTEPYPVPNAFLGIWEVYLMTGDREFLQENMPIIENFEQTARQRAKPGSLLTPFQLMVDEFDYSLRWKPVQKTFTKGGLQRAFDVPLEMVDFNAYLVELRRILMYAYQELGQPEQARFMKQLATLSAREVNQRLWDGQLNFYCDVRSDNGRSTGVRAISGFTPLYAQIVPPERKALLLQALDDPQGFGSPYPIPSVELRHPDLDPNFMTYGGDSLITSGVWMIVNALARNGEPDRAARYIHKAIEMVSKDGVSSSYSYNPITAKPNQLKHNLATQCAILNDLILRYIVGFTPRADRLFEFNPIALDISMNHMKWGPFVYKQQYNVLVEWNRDEYVVSVNGASLRFPKPTHVVAELDGSGQLRARATA